MSAADLRRIGSEGDYQEAVAKALEANGEVMRQLLAEIKSGKEKNGNGNGGNGNGKGDAKQMFSAGFWQVVIALVTTIAIGSFVWARVLDIKQAGMDARMFTKDDAAQMERRIMEDRKADMADLRRQLNGREP